jgi:SAM-dependent MidA family methyltransferase
MLISSINQLFVVGQVELGPGNGTLMSDILRASKKFPTFFEELTIHFVERSQDLRKAQYEALKCHDETMKNGLKRVVSASGANVVWHDTVDSLPDDKAMLVIGQEFLDAFPINQFVLSDGRWREKLVDINETSKTPFNFRFVLSPIDTPTSKMLESGTLKQIIDNSAAQSSVEPGGTGAASKVPTQATGARLHQLMRGHEVNLDASNQWMVPSNKVLNGCTIPHSRLIYDALYYYRIM